jgi:hypothetical protein
MDKEKLKELLPRLSRKELIMYVKSLENDKAYLMQKLNEVLGKE